MEAKFRDFEMKENERIIDYVKSTLNKESHKQAVMDKRKGKKTNMLSSTDKMNAKHKAGIKSSGYGYSVSSKENIQIHNARNLSGDMPETSCTLSEFQVDGGSFQHNSTRKPSPQTDADEESNISAGNSDTDKHSLTQNKGDIERPFQREVKSQLPSTAAASSKSKTRKSQEAANPKFRIVDNRVRKHQQTAKVELCPPPARGQDTPYLAKHPRERIVDFR